MTVGAHNTITAVYRGHGNFSTSASGNLGETVNKASGTTAVTSRVNPSLSGQSVTFTATVSVTAPGSGTPTVTVQFKDGASNLGTAQNVSTTNGVTTATFSTSALAVGSHSITAVYSGDSNFGTSTSSALTQTVDALPVITSANATTFGEGMTGTFTVTSTGFPTPALSESGSLPSGVTFTDNHDGTAKLSGTPATGTAGTYSITITATNTAGGPPPILPLPLLAQPQ